MEETRTAHVSVLKEMQARDVEKRELEELEELRVIISKGDYEPGQMERALELAEKYFGLE